MPWMLAAGAAAGIGGGLIGNLAASADREAAMDAMKQAQAIIGAVDIPSIESLQVVLEQLQQQGQLTPELESALTQQVSEMHGIQQDPALKDMQRSALESLAQQGRTGMTLEDEVAMNKIRNQTSRDLKANNESILQNMQQRGMAGSGSELAMKLQAAQGGAELASQQGMDVAAQAQQRALQALAASGQLAGSIDAQDFNQQADIARAQDTINQFNTANRQNVAARNTAEKQRVQTGNLSEKQRIADQNVGLGNQQEIMNKQAIADDFNRRLAKAQGMAGQSAGIAQQYNNQAQNTANMWSGIGSGVGAGLSAISQYKSPVAAPASGTNGASYAGGSRASAYYGGGEVEARGPQEKAVVPGDHPANDKIPAMLSEGEMVIPRSEVQKAKKAADKKDSDNSAEYIANIIKHLSKKK